MVWTVRFPLLQENVVSSRFQLLSIAGPAHTSVKGGNYTTSEGPLCYDLDRHMINTEFSISPPNTSFCIDSCVPTIVLSSVAFPRKYC